MSFFRHPYLAHGTIQTPFGAFLVHRGIIDAPDCVGELYGWARVMREENADPGQCRTQTRAIPHLTRRDESSVEC